MKNGGMSCMTIARQLLRYCSVTTNLVQKQAQTNAVKDDPRFRRPNTTVCEDGNPRRPLCPDG